MERPRYIESIEQKEGVIFSEFNLGNVDIDGKKFNKLELVYVKDSYPTNNLREMIYSANKKEHIYTYRNGIVIHDLVLCVISYLKK
jgi:hypothetical protein